MKGPNCDEKSELRGIKSQNCDKKKSELRGIKVQTSWVFLRGFSQRLKKKKKKRSRLSPAEQYF